MDFFKVFLDFYTLTGKYAIFYLRQRNRRAESPRPTEYDWFHNPSTMALLNNVRYVCRGKLDMCYALDIFTS